MQLLPDRGLVDGELIVGFVSGIFGTTGDVRVHLFNRESDLFRKKRDIVLINPEEARFATQLKCRSGAGGRVVGQLVGPASREDAAALRDWRIAIPKSSLPVLDVDEFYLVDLIGRSVVIGDDTMGTISEVHQSGPVDILEIALPDGGSTFVPALAEYIVDVSKTPLALHEAARGLFE